MLMDYCSPRCRNQRTEAISMLFAAPHQDRYFLRTAGRADLVHWHDELFPAARPTCCAVRRCCRPCCDRTGCKLPEVPLCMSPTSLRRRRLRSQRRNLSEALADRLVEDFHAEVDLGLG